MKIAYYQVTANLKREGNDITLAIDDTTEKFIREEELEEADNEIVNIAKRLGDENDQARVIAKATLLPGEEQRQVSLIIKKLIE